VTGQINGGRRLDGHAVRTHCVVNIRSNTVVGVAAPVLGPTGCKLLRMPLRVEVSHTATQSSGNTGDKRSE
jgi:hypothetical protein